MATHTVVALFDDYREAEAAIRDVEAAGIPSTDINLIANNADKRYGDYPQYGVARTDATDTGSAAGSGAGIGAVLGGSAGLLAGIGALAIPGVGPVVAAGAVAATLAGAGIGAAAIGGLSGALVEAGIPREHADIYAESVRRGGALITVRADNAMRDRVSDIFNRHAPADIEERAESWRQAGWKGFDATTHQQGRENASHEHPLDLGTHPHYIADVVTSTGQAGSGSGSTKAEAIASASRSSRSMRTMRGIVKGEPATRSSRAATRSSKGEQYSADEFVVLGSSEVFDSELVSRSADQAQQSMLRDIDAILARLENGIKEERAAMDALLNRLTRKAA